MKTTLAISVTMMMLTFGACDDDAIENSEDHSEDIDARAVDGVSEMELESDTVDTLSTDVIELVSRTYLLEDHVLALDFGVGRAEVST